MATRFEYESPRVEAEERRLTEQAEQVPTRVPAGGYMTAALGAMALSAGLKLVGRSHASLFVGQWVPTLLLLGVYNKVVKVAGSD